MHRAGSKRGRQTRAMILRFDIASDFAASRDAQRQILDAASRLGFNGHCVFAIQLALEEAMINAIKHGNRLNPKKQVKIEARLTAKRAEIVIEDQGGGFDRSSVPDPTLEENLERCSGRGILLIESYMNKVEWSRGGRRLKMVKLNKADVLPRD